MFVRQDPAGCVTQERAHVEVEGWIVPPQLHADRGQPWRLLGEADLAAFADTATHKPKGSNVDPHRKWKRQQRRGVFGKLRP